jgi:isopentenyl-diphosphate delta-isomerase
MPEAVIVAAARTPIGRSRKGSLVDARPDDLAAFAIDAALNKVPELDRAEIDLGVTFLGRRFAHPIAVAGMTGGHERALAVNRTLARVAARFDIPMGVGSQRAMLVNPALVPTYRAAREAAPDLFLIANVGLPQLLPQGDAAPFTLDDVRRAIEAIGAGALAIHLNYLQEAVQAEGDTNARGGLAALRALTGALDLPVIAKETGAGMTARAARQLAGAGVAALEVGGAGGTSFAAVEARRAADAGHDRLAALGRLFADWGVPTPAAVRMVRRAGLPVIATGGVRNGLDAAVALALGADVRLRVTMAPSTGGGSFVVRLRGDVAPMMAGRVLALANRRYYDGLTWHRVEHDFVVQGLGPGANEYVGLAQFFRDELGTVPHVRGTVGMSTRGHDTGDAQWFINLKDNLRLNRDYTVFAEVVEGIDVVDGIFEGDAVESIRVIRP